MLDYDDSAFLYFSVTLSGIFAVLSGYYVFYTLWKAYGKPQIPISEYRSEAERLKIAQLKSKSSPSLQLGKPLFVIASVIFAVCVIMLILLSYKIASSPRVAQFDPFEILGLETTAVDKDIRKAYRSLSLLYHPDKNIGNPKAQDMFVRINKAYESLTDPVAKENWEKFGNPDGRQALEVSIGLPSFLLSKGYRYVYIASYFAVVIIIIPLIIYLIHTYNRQYGDKNINYQTYTRFFTFINEQTNQKDLIEILAASEELRAFNNDVPDEAKTISMIMKKLIEKGDLNRPKFNHNAIVRGSMLLALHLSRQHGLLTVQMRSDLDDMLSRVSDLLEVIVDMCISRKMIKTAFCANSLIQSLVQATGIGWNPLMQLPHITGQLADRITQEIAHDMMKKNTKAERVMVKPFTQFIKLDVDKQKQLLHGMNDDEIADVTLLTSKLEMISMTTRIYVDDDDEGGITSNDVLVGDLMTLEVTLTRCKAGQTVIDEKVDGKLRIDPVHATYMSSMKRPIYWLIVVSEKGSEPMCLDKVTEQTRMVKKSLRFVAPKEAGTYRVKLMLLVDSYIGVNEETIIEFKVLSDAVRVKREVHQKDKEIVAAPSLLDDVMKMNDDDDSDEEEEKAATAVTTTTGTGTGEAKVVQVDDDDDDDDDGSNKRLRKRKGNKKNK